MIVVIITTHYEPDIKPWSVASESLYDDLIRFKILKSIAKTSRFR